LSDEVALVLDDGPVRGGVPSTVVDVTGVAGEQPRVLREGAISADQIAAVLEAGLGRHWRG
jgi:tRNA A37 threonylcarbamoyladenosine synthetase subunit TsaC/SUA5/YrdC